MIHPRPYTSSATSSGLRRHASNLRLGLALVALPIFLSAPVLAGALVVNGTVDDLGGANVSVGTVTLTNGGTITDGTLSATIFELQSGTVSAVLAGSGIVTKDDTDTVTLSGADTYTGGTNVNSGLLVVGSGSGLAAVGSAITVDGGILSLAGFQNYDFGGTGGSIIASGDLLMGSTTSPLGVSYSGTIGVGGNSVELLSSAMATIGGATIANGGQLQSFNGIELLPGGTLTDSGSASVSEGAFVNLGTVQGPTTGGKSFTFSGALSGAGALDGNVFIANSFSPTFGTTGTAQINGTVTFGFPATIALHIGGLVAGTNYDQIAINSGGTLHLSGTLQVDLVNGFQPQAGEVFTLLANSGSGTIVGTFRSIDFSGAALQPGLAWDTSEFATNGTVDVFSTIPEPGAGGAIIGLSILGAALAIRRRPAIKGAFQFLDSERRTRSFTADSRRWRKTDAD
jgi:MYXO-CTERM domain-containing protein